MKNVLISIRPKWIEKIISGEKTIEVRKTAPEEVPFKAYIYCTRGGEIIYGDDKIFVTDNLKSLRKSPAMEEAFKKHSNLTLWNGCVIGEFVCDKIEDFYCASVPYQKENNLGYGRFVDNGVYKVDGWHEGIVFERNDRFMDSMLNNNDLKEMCLSAQEVFDYIGIGKHLYGLHISDLKIYEQPKELSEFYRPCPVKEKGDCLSCDCLADNDYGGVCTNNLTRPPQSWCYVEELK